MLAMRRIQPRTTMILTTFLAAATNSKISQMEVMVISMVVASANLAAIVGFALAMVFSRINWMAPRAN